MREVHILASAVHGSLASLHLLGVIYNLRKKNWWDVLAHSLALAYSANAVKNHMKETQK